MMNALIPIIVILGLLALGGLTDIVLHKRNKDWLLIALNIGVWGCFFYLLYIIGA